MKTTTQFPVNPGTAVEVTCSYPEAINLGSNEVTCKSETYYDFETEPNCEIEGKSNHRRHVKAISIELGACATCRANSISI